MDPEYNHSNGSDQFIENFEDFDRAEDQEELYEFIESHKDENQFDNQGYHIID